MSTWKLSLIPTFLLAATLPVHAGVGTEGAAFLNIPVGAGPAALGNAYSALANDAYAPVINPGGLGFLRSTQISGQHLSYLDSDHYEYLSFVHPLRPGRAFGVSAQYLGTGDIPGTDLSGTPTGSFTSHWGAYNVSYGQLLTDKLSLGITGKLINAQIDDVSANAYAVDLGSQYKVSEKLMLAAVMNNAGTKLKFLDEGDSLPLAFHLGAAYRPEDHWNLSAEGVYEKTGLVSEHVGLEWMPLEMIAIRAGYRSDTTNGLSALAGFTTGLGLNVWGTEVAYAWLPLGDLGNTHYFSLLMKFGEQERERKNLIQYHQIKKHRTAKGSPNSTDDDPDYQQFMELLSNQETHTAKAQSTQSGGEPQ